MPAAVLLPAALVRLRAERFFLAVTDRLNTTGIHTRLRQSILNRVGATVAQCQVVLGGTPFVAVSLDGELNGRVLAQELAVALHCGLLVGPDPIRVIIEVDVFHVLREKLFLGKGSG